MMKVVVETRANSVAKKVRQRVVELFDKIRRTFGQSTTKFVVLFAKVRQDLSNCATDFVVLQR